MNKFIRNKNKLLKDNTDTSSTHFFFISNKCCSHLWRHFHYIFQQALCKFKPFYISCGCLRLFIYYPLEHFLYYDSFKRLLLSTFLVCFVYKRNKSTWWSRMYNKIVLRSNITFCRRKKRRENSVYGLLLVLCKYSQIN